MRNKANLLILIFLSMLACPFYGKGKQQSAEVYDANFFKQYLVENALEMILRLPGFVLEEEEDIRGFGSAAGNVLIDGVRPSSKAGGIRDALSRIPAKQVIKIEILRGGAAAGETAGQGLVANVIRKTQQKDGRWLLKTERADNGKLFGEAQINLSRQIKKWQTSFKAQALYEALPRKATIVTRDDQDNLISSQQENRPSILRDVLANGDGKRQYETGILQWNAQIIWSQYKPTTHRFGFNNRLPDPEGVIDSVFLNDRDSQFVNGELGVDWTEKLANDWSWRVIGLTNWQDWWVDATSTYWEPENIFDKKNIFRFDEDKSETIFRTTLGKSENSTVRPEYGFELAYNKLDSGLSLRDVDVNDNVGAVLSQSKTTAEETRAELFANVIWRSSLLIYNAGLAVEYSKISVSGDASDEQSLVYWKPNFSISYNVSSSTQYRINLERIIGQLDFSDFAASADLIDDRETSGNPRLLPERTDRFSLALDYRYGDKGAISLELFHEWRNGVLEQIVLPSGGRSLGDAGDGRVWGLDAAMNIPMDFLLENSLLEVKSKVYDSSFDDPITFEERNLSGLKSPLTRVNFRQDIIDKKLSWGVGYQTYNVKRNYFVNEIDYERNEPLWNAFFETTIINGTKTRFEITNIGKEKTFRERSVYQENRAGELNFVEQSNRERGVVVSLTFSRSF
ncbi:TonB-dependent receptor domain-containing protein [Aliikangiella coralliicola]|uniref:Uncharacterized protein n=1 Tax=Aliikangiella coralliicola TaxID=2592383 RepID=A0A545UGI9_9GAMM|nr:TonB-dependent receptor [Aliikangiella coralliicola]TQV88577.1 hypothetical protein FLL46_08650 [Aliikangiella coralliicola]